jgi:uroporphyrinogen decarboxylase
MQKNDRFINACRREPVDSTPIWLMRQAGRYMEEYRVVRAKHSFLEMCKTPDIAAEITLQPIKRFDLDAAIIFSDILLPLEKMGIKLAFTESGPHIETPVRSHKDVLRLNAVDINNDLSFVLEAIAIVKRELAGRLPLIGFCGAPFTLASYLIEGGGSKGFQQTKTLMYKEPETFHLLMRKLVDVSISYLDSQVSGGADAIQVFDSWVGTLSRGDYQEYVSPHMARLFRSLNRKVPHIHFGVGASHLLDLINDAGGDVIGVDWRVPIDQAWQAIGFNRAIQGNLDPVVLFGPREHLINQVDDILGRANGRPGHIFNLGHGILQGTPIDMVDALIEAVHSFSSRQ